MLDDGISELEVRAWNPIRWSDDMKLYHGRIGHTGGQRVSFEDS
ncbi:hypothetical protein GGR46_001155 [Sphingomonas kyeonggiensis]|uniref:Uncharacterized protein n=1 Tax=Sphingomonas kyeonggiensis TaxID=1268553 RepID=A0A7W6JSG1_9SPHN|nr:hypothetical protein [Sphingomonas kyeonggiensis]